MNDSIGVGYVALVALYDAAGGLLAAVGERCERVPADSIPWLFEQGLIAPAEVK
jgi:hypothetical protein